MVLAYVGEQADAIRVTDPLVRRNAPDSVHAMRVACRRMRSTMQSFRVVLERDRTDHLVDELRWLASQLGGARDLEVQEQRIGAAVSARPPGPERDEHLHEMRKAAKRLRYAVEALRPVRPRRAKRLVKQVKAVQDLLGEHQDPVVARGLMRELGAAATAEGGNGFAFGWLMRDEQAHAERVEAELDPAWANLRRRARKLTG